MYSSSMPPPTLLTVGNLIPQAGMTPSTTKSSGVNRVSSPRSLQYVLVRLIDADRSNAGQAWNNVNLVRLAEKIKSPLVL